MPDSVHLGLDNSVFNGRLCVPNKDQLTRKRPSIRYFDEQVRARAAVSTTNKSTEPPTPVWQKPLSKPPEPELDLSVALLATAETAPPVEPINPQTFTTSVLPKQQYSRSQRALIAMAAFVFLLGVAVSLQAFVANHKAASQVSALSKKVDKSTNSSVPSTTKPSSSAISNYIVAPDLPRYIKIPKLGINARVLQVGTTSSGALSTPSNVFDTAWYTGSAKPGQPGAMLIDGHVSSWTAHGVFYGLKMLHPGDAIQIQRGDGQVFNYQVVKTQTYPDNQVNMQAAMTPVVAGKNGLNLITCTGQVKPGTSEFNQRIIVFAEQI